MYQAYYGVIASFQELVHDPQRNYLHQQQLVNIGHPWLAALGTMILHLMFLKDVQGEVLRKHYHLQQRIMD